MRLHCYWLAVLLCLLAGCDRKPDATFALAIRTDANNPAQVEVVVTASDAAAWKTVSAKSEPATLEKILSVRLLGAPTNAASLIGDFTVQGRDLRFTPRLPLLAGEHYEARFNPATIPGAGFAVPVLTANYLVPAAVPATAPKLTAIYPTAHRLPANHLKFYLVFSEPMRQGEFLKHLKLLDAAGREVPEPFRETELWSTDGRRLTLWFHPGRQKTGVNLNVEIGPVLEAGQNYRLVVSGAWPSERGAALGADVEKAFAAGPAVHARLDTGQWKLTPPAAGTRDALRVQFPAPLDWALLQNQLHVETADGRRMDGTAAIEPEETAWSFIPAQAWSAGDHHLAIGTVLEDLAGNSVAKPFEVDVQIAPSAPAGPVAHRTFSIR